MARAATTTDAFNAVAEPRRRQLLDLLAAGERSVTDLVDALGLAQPLVSKHLRVLREVGLVRVRDAGRQRLYRLDAGPLAELAEWLRPYEQFINDRFDLMAEVVQELQGEADARDRDVADRHPDPDRP
jgi:DNA-binding transcriptional ArsR family regulator